MEVQLFQTVRSPFGPALVRYQDGRRVYKLDDQRTITVWPGSIVCRRCGRLLSSQESMRNGIGPACARLEEGITGTIVFQTVKDQVKVYIRAGSTLWDNVPVGAVPILAG